MTVKPLGDRVLVSRKVNEAKSAGGIIIPETAQEKTTEGVVVAVGTDEDVIKVKSGDKILFDKYAGTEIKIEGTDHLLMRMDDILAIIE